MSNFRGWNLAVKAALKKAGTVPVLSSVVAASQVKVRSWLDGTERPSLNQLNKMRKYLAEPGLRVEL